MDLTTQTPAQIDTVLAELWRNEQTLRAQQAAALQSARYYARVGRPVAASNYEAQAAELEPKIDEIRADAAPFEAEYARRPWNRYFLVQNNNGHVHRGMNCSTCFATTLYAWLIDLADCDEAAMVDEWGEKACTVCFPNAPTHPRFSQPSRQDMAEVAAKQAEKDAKAAAKAAKALDEPVSCKVDRYTERAETVAQATNALREQMRILGYYGDTHPSYSDAWVQILRGALIRKGLGSDEVDVIADRALTKALKEAGR